MIKNYTDFDFQAPDCHPGTQIFRANFKLDVDISEIFPYINAVAEDTKYFENPHYIQFFLNGYKCALYPQEVRAAAFENRGQAMEFFNTLKDYVNDVYSKKETIEPDHTKYKHVSVIEILKNLPKNNCKECGYPTCMAFADAVSKGEADKCKCPEYAEEVL